MIIYLTAPTKSRGPVLPGLRPTRACAPTWTCTVAEIARATRPSPAGMRFSSSLQVHAPQGEGFPHRRLAPPGLTPCANFRPATGPQTPAEASSDFTGSGARKFLTASSGCRRPYGLPVNAARSSTELTPVWSKTRSNHHYTGKSERRPALNAERRRKRLVDREGLEPSTVRLRVGCSTIELAVQTMAEREGFEPSRGLRPLQL
jgi:hypothetical protein